MTTLMPTELNSRRSYRFGIGILMLITVVSSFVSTMVHSALPVLASEASGVYFFVQKAFSGFGTSLGTVSYARSAVLGTPFGSDRGDIVLYSFVAVLAALALTVVYFLRTVKGDTTIIASQSTEIC